MPRLVYESPETELQKKLGYSFKSQVYLQEALTHSSFANERGLAQNNERLEFLGDAVLEVTISGALFEKFPDAREGDLTRMRAKLVSEGTLAEIAEKLGVSQCLILGKGEESQGGRERPALLADALEALFGAIYIDAGYEAAKACLLRLYANLWPASDKVQKGKDFKTHLQEVTQAKYRALPVYLPLASYGPEHEKTFEVKLVLPDGQEFCASGPSMKRAEQIAASMALDKLGIARKTIAEAPRKEQTKETGLQEKPENTPEQENKNTRLPEEKEQPALQPGEELLKKKRATPLIARGKSEEKQNAKAGIQKRNSKSKGAGQQVIKGAKPKARAQAKAQKAG